MLESTSNHQNKSIPVFVILIGLFAFCAIFLLVDQTYYRFISDHFPSVRTSFWLATAWGIVSRAPWILALLIFLFVRPRLLALQVGQMRSHWRFVLMVIVANCVVVGGFLLLSGSSTPYSGNQWLFTEMVTVPIVEELFWRGIVFSILFELLQKKLGDQRGLMLSVWLSGISFGLLHAANGLTGVPFQFVAIQTLNAVIWGVVYGYLRAKTSSVYPSIIAHAAMNLIVVFF